MSKVIAEKEIEKKVCDFAKSLGFLCYKLKSDSQTGLPDRIFIYHGTSAFVEFKRKGGKLRKMQEHVFSQLRQHNIAAFVIDNIDDGKDLINFMQKVALGRFRQGETAQNITVH